MKKILIPDGMNQYRADLHHHTTHSDGKLSPEEAKKIYMERGYSVIAYTDHTNYHVHNDLTDEHFLALNGVEVDVIADPAPNWKVNHLCWVALQPDITEEAVWKCFPNADPEKEPDGFRNTDRTFTPENVNRLIRLGHDNGFFVTYNHPTWSKETSKDYLQYHGMDAFEIVNGEPDCYDEENGPAYDEMLSNGERLFCVAADDSHGGCQDTSKFGGCIMLFAPKLEYTVITDALVHGNFYSQHDWRAPLIQSMVWEDGTVSLKTTPAAKVVWYTDRESGSVCAPDGGLLTEWTVTVPNGKYFRLEVKGESGSTTYTNAYFND